MSKSKAHKKLGSPKKLARQVNVSTGASADAGNIDIYAEQVTIVRTPSEAPQTNHFHWITDSQERLRSFLSKSIMDFGSKRASRVIDALVDKWLRGEVTVSLPTD